MFKIDKNTFVRDGRVTYIDEVGNKVIVIAERTGKSFVAKLKPESGIKVQKVKVNMPDDNPQIILPSEFNSFSEEEKEVFKALLNQFSVILERWVIISSRLLMLSSSYWNLAVSAKAKHNDTSYDDAEQSLGNGLLEQLNEYEETQLYTLLYTANAKEISNNK